MKHPRTLALLAAALVLYILASAGAAGVSFSPGVLAVSLVAVWSSLLPVWRRSDARDQAAQLVGALGSLVGLCLGAWLALDVRALLGELLMAAALPPLGVLTLRLAMTVPDVPNRLSRHLYAEYPARWLSWLAAGLGIAAALPPVWLFGRPLIAPYWFTHAPPAFALACAVVACVLRAFRRRLGSTTRAMAINLWPLLGAALALGGLVSVAVARALGWLGPSAWMGAVASAAAVFVTGHLWLVSESRATLASAWARELSASIVALALALGGFAFATLHVGDGLVPRVALCAATLAVFLVARGAARRLVHRWFAPQRGALLDALEAIQQDLPGAASYEELAGRVLRPLRRATGSPEAAPLLVSFVPPTEARLDAAGQPRIAERMLPSALVRGLSDAGGQAVVRDDLSARLVRRPELRDLVAALDQLDASCVVPLVVDAEVEGALVFARGARTDALTFEELAALERLSRAVAPMAAQFLAGERAHLRADEVAREREALREQLDEVEEELSQLRAELNLLKASRPSGYAAEVQYSAVMRGLLERLTTLSAQDTPVMLVAELGVPLEPLAERLLREGGRADKPLVVGDCAALSPDEQAAALFGRRAEGAMRLGWLELAAEGLLLLNDVLSLEPSVQEALAVALSERRARPIGGDGAYAVTARLVVSARQPLTKLLAQGAIVPELGRWLEHASVFVPPLRERREDLHSLVLMSIDRAARVLGRDVPGIAPEALQALEDYSFPGNHWELASVIERAVAVCGGTRIQLEDLPPLPLGGASAGTFVDQEREILRRAMERAGGNKTRAARALGLKRTTLIDKLRRLGLEVPGPQGAEH